MPARGLGMERYYSEYLEQREYGIGRDIKSIVSNIRKSGFKEGIRKFKEDKLKKLKGEVDDLSKKLKDARDRASSNEKPKMSQNESIEKSLLGKLGKDTKHLEIPGMGDFMVRTKDIDHDLALRVFENTHDRNLSSSFEKLNKSKFKNAINHPKGRNAEDLAHEMGHRDNSTSLNPIDRIRFNVVNRKTRSRFEDKNLNKNRSGFLDTAKSYLEGKSVISEESRATNKGIKYLKKSGISDDDLKVAEENLKNNLDTYKYDHEIKYRNPLINKLEKDLDKAKNKKGRR